MSRNNDQELPWLPPNVVAIMVIATFLGTLTWIQKCNPPNVCPRPVEVFE